MSLISEHTLILKEIKTLKSQLEKLEKPLNDFYSNVRSTLDSELKKLNEEINFSYDFTPSNNVDDQLFVKEAHLKHIRFIIASRDIDQLSDYDIAILSEFFHQFSNLEIFE